MRLPVPSQRGLSLRSVLPDAQFLGADDLRVTSCCGDSRQCRAGDLYVAMPGSLHDGHDFLTDAKKRGVAAVVVERPLPGLGLPVCIVEDSRDAYGRICQALAGNPSQRMKVVGVTGTNGKTTTSHLIASVLETGGYPVAVMGTLGAFDGCQHQPASHTTPTAPVLANWLARAEANGCTHAVLEVSSHALQQARVAGIEFDSACVTNVRHDHLDYHETWQDYWIAKAKLLSHLLPEGVALFNADDPGSIAMLDRATGPAMTVGIDFAAEISAEIVDHAISEQTFLLSSGPETLPVRTNLIGRHNVSNCLMAAAVGEVYGIDLASIARGLENVKHVAGRLERIECGQPFGVFVDYAHTADALAGVLESLRPVTSGRLICVFGAGGDRDKFKRPLMGNAVECGADLAVVTSDNPRTEDPKTIMADVLSGFHETYGVRAIVDRAEAIAWALEQAQPGDCVLIAGKGHEEFQEIGRERIPFDDREVARERLYEHQGQFEYRRAA